MPEFMDVHTGMEGVTPEDLRGTGPSVKTVPFTERRSK